MPFFLLLHVAHHILQQASYNLIRITRVLSASSNPIPWNDHIGDSLLRVTSENVELTRHLQALKMEVSLEATDIAGRREDEE